MFYRYLPHGKVVDVGRCNRSANPLRCGRNQAIRLMQGHTALGELAAPSTRLDGLRDTKWRQTQRIEQTAGSSLLAPSQSSPNLLDRYRANPWVDAAPPQTGYPRCGRATSKRVDQYGRIEQQPRHASTRPAIIATALAPHPLRRVVVPVVTAVVYPAQGRFDIVPAPFVVKTPPNEFADERAAPSGTGTPIKFHHEMVGHRYVQSHVPNLAHKSGRGDAPPVTPPSVTLPVWS